MERRPRAGVIVIDKKGRHLIVKGKTGKWSFPKGKQEEGESLYCAALREAMEEAGIDLTHETCISSIQLSFGTYYYFKLNKYSTELSLQPPSNPEEILEVAWKKRKPIQNSLEKNADLTYYFKQNYAFRRPCVPL